MFPTRAPISMLRLLSFALKTQSILGIFLAIRDLEWTSLGGGGGETSYPGQRERADREEGRWREKEDDGWSGKECLMPPEHRAKWWTCPTCSFSNKPDRLVHGLNTGHYEDNNFTNSLRPNMAAWFKFCMARSTESGQSSSIIAVPSLFLRNMTLLMLPYWQNRLNTRWQLNFSGSRP